MYGAYKQYISEYTHKSKLGKLSITLQTDVKNACEQWRLAHSVPVSHPNGFYSIHLYVLILLLYIRILWARYNKICTLNTRIQTQCCFSIVAYIVSWIHGEEIGVELFWRTQQHHLSAANSILLITTSAYPRALCILRWIGYTGPIIVCTCSLNNDLVTIYRDSSVILLRKLVRNMLPLFKPIKSMGIR